MTTTLRGQRVCTATTTPTTTASWTARTAACNYNDPSNGGICDVDDPLRGVIDILGICNGHCVDVDNDQICDDEDNCIDLDECGVCGPSTTMHLPGCIDGAACNFDRQPPSVAMTLLLYTDECGNCGGSTYAGCTDAMACNYDASRLR